MAGFQVLLAVFLTYLEGVRLAPKEYHISFSITVFRRVAADAYVSSPCSKGIRISPSNAVIKRVVADAYLSSNYRLTFLQIVFSLLENFT
ncbi:hypothetical protein Nepgr_018546 [Nepenthes gracilis]|uniref:Secreted protein n=1 Tax=Nepenthes gracilis TaxID=150966 RepID=A0AAD3STI3_NEPGR|nr:hypothetical protein Nepgr_018546 [Nepenthes gracilis]